MRVCGKSVACTLHVHVAHTYVQTRLPCEHLQHKDQTLLFKARAVS